MVYVLCHQYLSETGNMNCLVMESDKNIRELVEIYGAVHFLLEEMTGNNCPVISIPRLRRVLTKFYGMIDRTILFDESELNKITVPLDSVFRKAYLQARDGKSEGVIIVDRFLARESCCGDRYKEIMKTWLPKGRELEELRAMLCIPEECVSVFGDVEPIKISEVYSEMLKRETTTKNILGCTQKYGEGILLQEKKGNFYVQSSVGKEPFIEFVKNQIYQGMKNGDSMVVIDPGRMIDKREMWIYLMIHGYRVEYYCLNPMDESNCFNCFYGLGKNDEKLIQRIASDILDNQKYNMVPAVEKISKVLLSAVMLAAMTEMKEEDRNMVEIAKIFRSNVSGAMLDKILRSMFDKLEMSHPAKKLFEIYSEAPGDIKISAIHKISSALKVYEDCIRETLTEHRYDLEMLIKQKTVLFVIPGEQVESQTLLSVFMERVYDSTIKAAEKFPDHREVQFLLMGYPGFGKINGLDTYMKDGKEQEIFTTLCAEIPEQEKMIHNDVLEQVDHVSRYCEYGIFINRVEPDTTCDHAEKVKPRYRESIICGKGEDSIVYPCCLYESKYHPYKIPEDIEDLLTMYSSKTR